MFGNVSTGPAFDSTWPDKHSGLRSQSVFDGDASHGVACAVLSVLEFEMTGNVADGPGVRLQSAGQTFKHANTGSGVAPGARFAGTPPHPTQAREGGSVSSASCFYEGGDFSSQKT